MGRMIPWLIAGWILFGQRPRGRAESSTLKPAPSTPPLTGYLYRLPDDAYETTRLALTIEGKDRQVGIFTKPADALAVVQQKGWALADANIRELKEALPE